MDKPHSNLAHALGIPPEYGVLLAAKTAVADGFMTRLNTTGYLTADLIIARFGAGLSPKRSRR